MTLLATSYLAPQFQSYKFNWIKFYETGTTTPKSMATDISGGTLILKAEVNINGFFATAGGTVFIPFVDGVYDAYLFPTEAEADANDTSNAVRLADNIDPFAPINLTLINDISQSYEYETRTELVNSVIVFPDNKRLDTLGFATKGDVGPASYIVTSGVSPNSGSPAIAGGKHAALINEGGILRPEKWGVLADNNGTTGNGNDDTQSWLDVITYAKASDNPRIISPKGRSRITASLDFTRLIVDFRCPFLKDFDGVGINILEGGSTFTELTNPAVVAAGTQSAGSHGFNVRDSRVKLKNARSQLNGGCGYYHLDDDGNNNFCEIDIFNGGNGEHGVHIDKGVQGDDSNGWIVHIKNNDNGGDGVRVDAIAKDWRGFISAEDNGGIGFNAIEGRRMDLTVYLETNTGGDYVLSAASQFIIIRGRLGSGSNLNTGLNWVTTGGIETLVGGTTAIVNRVVGSNMTSSGSNHYDQEFYGSGGELMSRIRHVANSDINIQSIDRTDGVTVLGFMGVDASDRAFRYGNGTDTCTMYVGVGDPNGVITARAGQLYSDQTLSIGKFYVKQSGNPSNTGWVLK